MIPKIIELLQTNDFYGVSEKVDIAKGRYELITTFKDGKNKVKRIWLSRKK